jgi:hypothetical protein
MPNAGDIRWFKEQFHQEIEASLAGTLFDLDMLVAIACQETGYIWSVLRKKPLSKPEILALCVGDTLDASRGRRAFPRTKADLIAKPNGQEMFDVARKALVDMATYIPGYRGAASNPDKFCHGFGVFQRDLQFFLEEPDYFLERRYEDFDATLAQCVGELKRGVKKLGFENKPSLSDLEFAYVAIAYNTGGFNPSKGLKQGHFNGSRFYGEEVYDFVRLSRTVGLPSAAVASLGRFVVVARSGLQLRKGPGLEFGISKTIESGAEISVVGFDGPDDEWARVDLENDGLVDGHMFAAFLLSADAHDPSEEVEEPAGAQA